MMPPYKASPMVRYKYPDNCVRMHACTVMLSVQNNFSTLLAVKPGDMDAGMSIISFV